MLESLSPIDVALIKKIGGNGSSYTLPIASSTVLGGVQPAAKIDAMTQTVGVDADGALWTEPGGDAGSDVWEHINTITVSGDETTQIVFSEDASGNPIQLKKFYLYGSNITGIATKFMVWTSSSGWQRPKSPTQFTSGNDVAIGCLWDASGKKVAKVTFEALNKTTYASYQATFYKGVKGLASLNTNAESMDYAPITSVYAAWVTAAAINDGAVFELYGVRM